MSDVSKDDEAKEARLKRMPNTPPKRHKRSGEPKPAARSSGQKKDQQRKSPKARS